MYGYLSVVCPVLQFLIFLNRSCSLAGKLKMKNELQRLAILSIFFLFISCPVREKYQLIELVMNSGL